MPSPDNALKGFGGKSQEKQQDFGAKLSKRRSQDFASKIQGWNDHGGGVTQKQEKPATLSKSKDPSPTPTTPKVEVFTQVPNAKSKPTLDSEPSPNGSPADPRLSGSDPVADSKVAATKKTDVLLSRQGWVRRKSKAGVDAKPPVDLALEVKHAGTPKKRVVSDGHWRRDRQAKDEAGVEEVPKEVGPKPITIRRSVVNVGIKVPPTTQEYLHTDPASSKSRPPRQFRSRSNSVSDGDNDHPPDFESTGTKVYIKRRRRSKTFDGLTRPEKDSLTPESFFTASPHQDKSASPTNSTSATSQAAESARRPSPQTRPSSRDLRSGRTPSTPKTTSPITDSDLQRPSSSRRRTKTPVEEELDRPRNLRTSKSYSHAIPANPATTVPAAPVTPRIYGNRIEGWLADTTDPFFTEKQDPNLTPQPLRISNRKSKKQLDSANEIAEEDSEQRNGQSSIRRRRSRTSPNLHDTFNKFAEDSTSVDSTTSGRASPALRRSGAQRGVHSPVKGQDLHGVPSSQDNEGNTSKNRYSAAYPLRNPRAPLTKRASVQATADLAGAFSRARTYSPPSDPSDQGTLMPDDVSAASDSELLPQQGDGIKRRLTKHSDLMSVLSQSRDDQTIISSRSSRRRHPASEASTIAAIMNELSIDELQYQRELRTLVDGVIPVLLKHALSDTKSGATKRVFSGPANDPSTTKPIVDMGVALERLKTMHRRIPMHEPLQLITWAETASKLYADYFQAWRLGFKDVVVNLAPAQPGSAVEREDHTVAQNQDGYLVDGEGDRMDVAFLLKRPLVRVKHLAKTFKRMNQLEPSPGAGKIAIHYQDLVTEAKQRIVDENARLEDEAAAMIDATRARDPRSLGPIIGVTIDPARCVRARDYFDMELYHSSGQQVVCKIEMIYRDDATNRGSSGDVLFCEVSTTGRWLLFPPLPVSLVTARRSDKAGELIVMIRGFLADARQWRELMFLQPDEEQASSDWLNMLGSTPLPPRIVRKSTFHAVKAQATRGSDELEAPSATSDTVKSRDPSPREIEVPLGEQVESASRVWDGSELSSIPNEKSRSNPTISSQSTNSTISSSVLSQSTICNGYGNNSSEPAYFWERQEPRKPNGNAARRPVTSYARTESEYTVSTASSYSRNDYSVWMPASEKLFDDEDSADEDDRLSPPHGKRPSMRRRTSSVPSSDMPTIPKLRKTADEPATPTQRSIQPHEQMPMTASNPVSAPAKLQKNRPQSASQGGIPAHDPATQPSTPTTQPVSRGLTLGLPPSLTPAFLKKNRRPSSPLKHEYEPSTESDSLTDSDLSDLDDLESVTSKSSAAPDEAISTVGTLKAFQNYTQRPLVQAPQLSALPTGSPGPSESASQGPYRSIPSAGTAPARLTASIFTWSDSGSWVSLHPEACSIFVTPGLIEAFDVLQADSVDLTTQEGGETTPSSRGIKPLVALELTPLVPLRRGTAVDISIRSPPNARSLIRTGSNIMFRSQHQDDCDRLYALINRARIDNPTYIALQNARGPQHSNWGEIMDNRNAQRTANASSSWWKLGSRKSSTYRSSGSRPASIAATESSVGTMNSAFSALRRLSGGSRFFNIAKSTITSKDGTRSSNSESLSSGVGTPLNLDPRLGTPLGIPQTKIRLYVRESPSKWRDMGSARMTVMLPPNHDSLSPNPISGSGKRVLIYGKSKGELLLDQTLGETCFERVARTGIAVSVWEDATGPIGQVAAIGGVTPSRSRVYMIQLRTERETAYTFGLVGKLRY